MAGQVVLITGCSSGFGLLTSIRAAQAGHRVVATMRDLKKRQTLDAAVAAAGVSVDVRALDIASADSITTCVQGVLRDLGPVDVLVNNAGFGMGGTVYDLSMDELREQMETNFFGTIAMTKAVLPEMIRRRSGFILQVSSNSARHPTPGVGAYAASKAGLEAITESLRYELSPFNIRVTSVQPGMFKTDAYQKRRLARAFGEESSPFRALSERGLSKIDGLFERSAKDPGKVADLLVKLFDNPRPPSRLMVGTDAKIQTIARALLPERAWERIIRSAVGF
jgi:NAD(P)-dependent dehydrogenase (short-subunit alcohol dehydrogenase family)